MTLAAKQFGSEVKGQRDSKPCVADDSATSKTANIPPLYLVEVDYGRHGRAFMETDRDTNSRVSLIGDILSGQYDRGEIVTILEIFEDEGTCRNVTEDIANEVLQEIYRLGLRDRSSATDFVDAYATKGGERLAEDALEKHLENA